MAEATPEEFIEKLLDGATLVAHPDTLADVMSRTDSILWLVFKSAPKLPIEYLEPGRLYAMKVPSLEQTLERLSAPVWKRDDLCDFGQPHYRFSALPKTSQGIPKQTT